MRAHKAGSHSRQGWETLTAQAIRAVLQRKGNDQPGVVFMAWGLPAQKAFSSIGIDEVRPRDYFDSFFHLLNCRQKKHLLLK